MDSGLLPDKLSMAFYWKSYSKRKIRSSQCRCLDIIIKSSILIVQYGDIHVNCFDSCQERCWVIEKDIYLTIVLNIIPQSTIWATIRDKTKTTFIQIPIILYGGSIHNSYRQIKIRIRINPIQYLVARIDLFNHLDLISKIKDK